MKKYLIAFVLVLGVISLAFFSKEADPNPDQILTKATAAATTTVTYIAAGTATTTLSWDTQEDGGFSVDEATLNIMFAATTTTSILNIQVQHSQNGIDWFPGAPGNVTAYATSSTPFDIGTIQTVSYRFSSTTQDQIAVTDARSATSTRATRIPVPERYVRAIFSIDPAGGNGAFWAQFVGKRENR